MAVYECSSPGQTRALGERLAAVLRPGSVVAYTGGLGAGKTTFTTGLAAGLGCTDEVSSPTYAIVNYYRGPRPLAHFDLYRLSTPEDLESAGFYDYLDAGCVLALEWSEQIELPQPPDVRVDFAHAGEGKRRITIEGACGL